jgi:hypothetical protein
MYALAFMTFDEDFESYQQFMRHSNSRELSSGLISENHMKIHLLWQIHRYLLDRFSKIHSNEYGQENYDQFAIYFDTLSCIPGGKELLLETLGKIPQISGPGGNIPSRLHAMTYYALQDALIEISPKFDLFNEFSGLRAVFPIDIAVFYGSELYAFVEVDGEFHYKMEGSVLQRKDYLKSFIYSSRYPGIPLYRIRGDQINRMGVEGAGKALAKWMTRQYAPTSPIAPPKKINRRKESNKKETVSDNEVEMKEKDDNVIAGKETNSSNITKKKRGRKPRATVESNSMQDSSSNPTMLPLSMETMIVVEPIPAKKRGRPKKDVVS